MNNPLPLSPALLCHFAGKIRVEMKNFYGKILPAPQGSQRLLTGPPPPEPASEEFLVPVLRQDLSWGFPEKNMRSLGVSF